MILGKKVVVVMPAYNAARTLEKTYREIDLSVVDHVILVDDGSSDETKIIAERLGIDYFEHKNNLGYGGNQKTCYTAALDRDADIVVMVHPDYQYTPLLIAPMAYLIATGLNDCVLGSRIIGGGALKGGMPLYKYLFNRLLTAFENVMTQKKLSEYHTGLRAFSKEVLKSLPLNECHNDFVFDNEMLAQILYFDYSVGEISCPTKYFKEASSINFKRSVQYGLGVLRVSLQYRFNKLGILRSKIFNKSGGRLRNLDERSPFIVPSN